MSSHNSKPDETNTDNDLLDAWRAGDVHAGDRLFDRHAADLHRFFSRRAPDSADDLVQSTLLACVEQRDRFRKQSSFRTYLFAIARFQLYAYRRRRRMPNEPLSDALVDDAASPRNTFASCQQRELVRRAVLQLPGHHRAVLQLAYWGGLGSDALGAALGVSATTARSRLHRARHVLRHAIERTSRLANPGDSELTG